MKLTFDRNGQDQRSDYSARLRPRETSFFALTDTANKICRRATQKLIDTERNFTKTKCSAICCGLITCGISLPLERKTFNGALAFLVALGNEKKIRDHIIRKAIFLNFFMWSRNGRQFSMKLQVDGLISNGFLSEIACTKKRLAHALASFISWTKTLQRNPWSRKENEMYTKVNDLRGMLHHPGSCCSDLCFKSCSFGTRNAPLACSAYLYSRNGQTRSARQYIALHAAILPAITTVQSAHRTPVVARNRAFHASAAKRACEWFKSHEARIIFALKRTIQLSPAVLLDKAKVLTYHTGAAATWCFRQGSKLLQLVALRYYWRVLLRCQNAFENFGDNCPVCHPWLRGYYHNFSCCVV